MSVPRHASGLTRLAFLCVLFTACTHGHLRQMRGSTIHKNLDNGIEVLIVRDARQPLIALEILHRAGSRHDPAGAPGMAHLVEHMMLQGSQNISRLARLKAIELAGATYDAATGYDFMRFYATFPPEQLDIILRLERDRMANAADSFDNERLNNQLAVIEQELRGGESGYAAARDRVESRILAATCYGGSIGGDVAALRQASVDDVRYYAQQFLSPPNSIIVAVGDLDPDAVFAAIASQFSSIKTRVGAAASSEDGCLAPRSRLDPAQAPAAKPDSKLHVSWHINVLPVRESLAFELAAEAIGNGKMSFLRRFLASHALNIRTECRFVPRELAMLVICDISPRDTAEKTKACEALKGFALDTAVSHSDSAFRTSVVARTQNRLLWANEKLEDRAAFMADELAGGAVVSDVYQAIQELRPRDLDRSITPLLKTPMDVLGCE